MSATRMRAGSKNASTTGAEDDGATNVVNRRALLRSAGLAAAGGGAAVALTGLGAKPARAANGNPVILGALNSATYDTSVTTTSGRGLSGGSSDPNGAGVAGTDSSASGSYGVSGYSYNGVGVAAQSAISSPLILFPGTHSGPLTTGTHNVGEIYVDSSVTLWLCTASGTPGTWRPIVVGGLTNNVGAAQTVLSASVPGVAALNVLNATSSNPLTGGLYARVGAPSGQALTAAVIGDSDQAPGVAGASSTHAGVVGMTSATATPGGNVAGVFGSDVSSSGSAGVLATSLHGTALQVVGPSTFSLSGVATVVAGSRSITVSGVSLRSNSFVLATIQQVAAGYSIESAVPSASTNTITIRLNKTVATTVSAGIKVAWFVVN